MAETAPVPESPSPSIADRLSGAGQQITSFRNEIDAKGAELKNKIDAAAAKTTGLLRPGKVGAPTKHNILVEPVYAAGDIIDATAGTAARRVWEVIDTTGAMIRATLKTATDWLHPIKTLKNFPAYLANYGRIFTTSIENYAHIFNAIPRTVQEIYERGIARPSQRILEKFPVIGKGVEKLRSGLGWLMEQPRNLTEWLTKPIYGADDWMKAAQA
ncbi:MAG: hypothetical protein WC651_04080 [Candidatus Gracilibacteria bacterium]|jgi:hypothetical protein